MLDDWCEKPKSGSLKDSIVGCFELICITMLALWAFLFWAGMRCQYHYREPPPSQMSTAEERYLDETTPFFDELREKGFKEGPATTEMVHLTIHNERLAGRRYLLKKKAKELRHKIKRIHKGLPPEEPVKKDKKASWYNTFFRRKNPDGYEEQ
eukprot:gene5256-6390_t